MRTLSLPPSIAVVCACAGVSLACSTGAIEDTSTTFGNTFSTSLSTTGPGDGDGDGDRETETGHDGNDTSDTTTGPSEPSCDDAELNQGESDVDCGGPCSPCAEGQSCAMPSDCVTMSCIGGVCVVPACDDGVANGDETDVDCGGPCSPCADGLGCVVAGDCQSMVCAGSFCAAPNCGDAVLNGEETDVDCGGPGCPGCLEGETCIGDSDCVSQYCPGGQCAPADCLVDADCANFNDACTTGVCSVDKTCQAAAANEGGMCDDGDLCSTGEQCSAGSCGGGSPVDCSGMSDNCNVGVCNPDDGMCQAQAANEGNPCDDANACTVAEVCGGGSCLDPNDPGYIFFEDFADNGAGWQLGTNWQIGAASVSNCAASCPGNDPSTDHTPDNNNGVAGVTLGGCAPTAQHADYCLTSPVINTTVLPDSVWLTFWRHLHSDYPDFMTSSVQVFDGQGWAQVWANACCSCVNDVNWSQQAYDVTPYKNANFRVRFCYKIEAAGVYSSGGWNIDDVTIAAGQCTP